MKFQDEMAWDGVEPIKGYTSYQEWMCRRKRQFLNEDQARAAISKKNADKLRPYECDECGGWHLTSNV